MKGIKLVTFDATNTLLRFRVPAWEYYAIVAKKYGYTGTVNTLKENMNNSYLEMSKKYPNFGKETIAWYEWWNRVVNMTLRDGLPEGVDINAVARDLIDEFKTPKCWCKTEGSEEIIKYLNECGITVGIISNFDPRLYEILLRIGFNNDFKFVVTSYDLGISKPDKKIFEYTQNIKKVSPEECVHIGDDVIKDYHGARVAGWHSFLVTDKEVPDTVDPNHVFKNLYDLHDYLEMNDINDRDD